MFYSQVVLLEDLRDDLAEELVQKCPVNVFDIEDLSNGRETWWALLETIYNALYYLGQT